MTIQPTRIQHLNDESPDQKGRYVLYWMQASQRTRFNHALEYAIEQANSAKLPILVYFGLTDDYPNANLRHYRFMHEGLRETQEDLRERGIQMVVLRTSPGKGAIRLADKAHSVIVDAGYLRHQKAWRRTAAERIKIPLIQVESDVVVPISTVSEKQEYAARTIRPKIFRHLEDYLEPVAPRDVMVVSNDIEFESVFDISDLDAALEQLDIDRSVAPVSNFCGGYLQALKRLDFFIENILNDYHEQRNDPSLDQTSLMSAYLHFGQISPLEIAFRIRGFDGPGTEALIEEMVIRRELSMNFVNYNSLYDQYDGIPEWAKRTLDEHRGDPREYLYDLEELEQGSTHDEYWNAAQLQMVRRGHMHGYMRMYWAKKILEWSATPEEAFKHALYLNDKYELDGRDPNGYTGVSWCFGTHDRPWQERPIFGKIRYMNANGLRRKFDIDEYVRLVNQQDSS